MAPENKFTKKEILQTAFKIATEEGLYKVTVRKIAKELGCSVAPIYVNFKNFEELKESLIKKISEKNMEMMTQNYTDTYFLNIGIGSFRFAKKYSKIFRDLMENGEFIMHSLRKEECLIQILNQMRKDKELKDLTNEELQSILFKMEIFTHGIASFASFNRLPENYTEQDIIKLLKETGGDIIFSTKSKRSEKNEGNNN